MASYKEGMLKEGALSDKVILVTGGGTGLGKAMATYYSELGAKIIISSRKQDVLDKTAEEITTKTGNEVLAVSADVKGTIKIWDLRQRKQFASIPAHSNLITQLQYGKGEFLASSSFDGTCKTWSTRDFQLLGCGRGHEGKVMGLGLLLHNHSSSVVTCGFDKTLKLWR